MAEKLDISTVIRKIIFKSSKRFHDVESFFMENMSSIQGALRNVFKDLNSMKFNMILNVCLEKLDTVSNEMIYSEPFFVSGYFLFITLYNLSNKLVEMISKIVASFEKYASEGSGWRLKSIISLEIKCVKVNFSIKGGSLVKLSCLPARIKKCCFILKKYPKNQCLYYAIAASHYKPKDRLKKNLRSFVNSTFKNINNNRVKLKSIPKLERLYNLSLNIFSWNQKPYILYNSENTSITKKINILLYKGHYSLITNINVFLVQQGPHKFMFVTNVL